MRAATHSAVRGSTPFAQEPLSMVVLRWLAVAIVVPFLVFGGFSGYRAWVQVRSLTLHSSGELRAGSSVTVDASSWARTRVAVRLVLAQGPVVDTLLVHRMTSNHQASLDPRPRDVHLVSVLTSERLARFSPGPARLLATAVGGPQWLRTPPPTVRELAVTIAPPQRSVPALRY